MITNDATFVLFSALNSTDVNKPLSEQAINKIYNDLMNKKDVVETTGSMMYNLEIGPYATSYDMNQEVIRYVDEYSIKIAGLIGMARQECDPCQVIMDKPPNVQDKEGCESVEMFNIDASSQRRKRDYDSDEYVTPESRVKSRSVYGYDTSDNGRVVMKYDDRPVDRRRADRPTARTMTLNENMSAPTVVTSSTAGLHQTSSGDVNEIHPTFYDICKQCWTQIDPCW